MLDRRTAAKLWSCRGSLWNSLELFKAFIFLPPLSFTMRLEINLGFVVLALIFAVVIVVRYLLVRKTRRRLWKLYYEDLEEQEAFLEAFNVSSFNDFSAFDFNLGSFSHVSPFPKLIEGDWRYRIYLSGSEVEDIVTVTHEISECTLGRTIERLLNLESPLYLLRRETDKFWVHGKKQKYLIEHVMATLGEVDDLTHWKLKQRLNKEDVKAWLNRGEE